MTFKCDHDDSKSKFYRSSNAILGRLGRSAPANVLLKLINTQGVPILLYGIPAVTLTEAELRNFSRAYNSIFSKIFETFDKNVIACCQYYSGYLCFNRIYDMHRYNFLDKLINNGCIFHRSEIDQLDYRDYVLLRVKYKFTPTDTKAKFKSKIWNNFKDYITSLSL